VIQSDEVHAMTDFAADTVVFVTLVRSAAQRADAGLLIDGIRSFGGLLGRCPIWVFETGEAGPAILDAQSRPLAVPEAVATAPFAAKVYACARAEALAGPEVESLVWISPDCLVLNPPLLMALGPEHDAAVRPVHIRNVGLAATDQVDPFWSAVYRAAGVDDVALTVESFVDGQHLRAYFNSHILSIRPSLGLCREWFELFAALATDEPFQAGAGRDPLHQIFLHQAVLSALLATRIDPDRLRTLPPDYSYPYNLQDRVPPDRRAAVLNELVCIAREDRPLHPDDVHDIAIREPLRAWLAARVTKSG
jgi:hypothetical protein